jgi:uncharacterized protein YjbJ (UPF0337 family)
MGERVEELKGSMKEAAGKVTGNERLEGKGKGQKAGAKMARETKGAANQVAGKVKDAAGEVTDDPRLEAEGEAQNLKGRSQSAG